MDDKMKTKTNIKTYILCKYNFHEWEYIFPLTKIEMFDNKEYRLIKGHKCLNCGEYSDGSLFFINNSQSDERPLIKTKRGYEKLDDNGKIINEKCIILCCDKND
jgi:hypothetical protein